MNTVTRKRGGPRREPILPATRAQDDAAGECFDNSARALGLAFIGLCVFVVIVEFFKSGDIRLGPFMLDLIFSVTAIVAGTALLTHIVMQPEPAGGLPSFHYLLGGVVLLVDAILSPFNSFRTALRNFQVGGDA